MFISQCFPVNPVNPSPFPVPSFSRHMCDIRYWFTTEEEKEVMASNAAFYKHAVEEDVFLSCFRRAEEEEKTLCLSAAEIFRRLKAYNSAAMCGVNSQSFGSVLSALGVERIHTRYGNQYRVVPLV